MYPHNKGTIRHFKDGKEESFQSHIPSLTATISSVSSMYTSTVIEANLIDL